MINIYYNTVYDISQINKHSKDRRDILPALFENRWKNILPTIFKNRWKKFKKTNFEEVFF